MARKRNVDAESHLLTGGLITGFLTFMGFLPGAAASAVVTGSLVRNDIQKAKKQEAFQRDFAAHQVRCEKGRAEADKEVQRIIKLLDNLAKYDFDPNSEKVAIQEKLEAVFCGAKITEFNYYESKEKKRRSVSVEDMIEIASKINAEDKIVELLSSNKEPSKFIVKTEDGEIYTSLGLWDTIPYNLRKQVNDLGVAFRKYTYSELEPIKARIACKIKEPYQFDYSKYR